MTLTAASLRRRTAALLISGIVAFGGGGATASGADRLDGLSGQELADAKTREEIRNLLADDKPDFAAIAGAITAAVAVGSLILTLRKQIADASAQRSADRIARAEALDRRFDEQFNRLVQSLGANQPATRAGAAVGLTRFLRPEHVRFHDDVTGLLGGSSGND